MTVDQESIGFCRGGCQTAEIDEDVFLEALDAVKQWGNADQLDEVLFALFDGDVVQITKPRNS